MLHLVRFAAVVLVAGAFALISPWVRPGFPAPVLRGPGAVLGYGLGGQRELDELGTSWYWDYGSGDPLWVGQQRLYFADLRTRPDRAAAVAREHPGQWWTFGNEPNDVNQDNILPEQYVRPYHDLYMALKSADPQARLVPAGVANADWRWLDAWRNKYREAYGRYPPVDGWRFHNYLLENCEDTLDVSEFKRRAAVFVDWTRRIGDTRLPIFLTEYGVLYGNGCCGCPTIPEKETVAYMQATSRWLAESGVITAWSWFAVDTNSRYNGELFNQGQILSFGKAYQSLVREWKAGAR